MTTRASSSLLTTSLRSTSIVSKKWLPRTPHQGYSVLTEIQQPLSESLEPEPPKPKHNERYFIKAAVLLSRSPTLTRPPTPFEAAMQEYNARIGRALFNPFPTHFYFKSGSVLKSQFNKEERLREKEAFDWKKRPKKQSRRGKHYMVARQAKGQPAPEKKTGDETESGEKEHPGLEGESLREEEIVVEKMAPEETAKVSISSSSLGDMAAGEEQYQIISRITEADRLNDTKSLNRKGERNLYLVIKRGKGMNQWVLPGGLMGLQEGELLHEAAARELAAECGVNMDTWIVGRQPIAYMDDALPSGYSTLDYAGCKTFFFKAHIMAGQVDPAISGLADFAWLTKEEIKRAVTPHYWTNIRGVLSDF